MFVESLLHSPHPRMKPGDQSDDVERQAERPGSLCQRLPRLLGLQARIIKSLLRRLLVPSSFLLLVVRPGAPSN